LVRLEADQRADRMVRLATIGVVGWNVALVARFSFQFFEFVGPGHFIAVGVLGCLAYLLVSTVLVLLGVRGVADAVSWLMLAALAAIVLCMLPFGGPIWAVILGPPAGFALVFMRRPWSLIALGVAGAAAVADSFLAVIPPAWVNAHATGEQFASYDVVVVVWTGIAVAVLVWLARILRDLQAARRELADRALVVERQRIDDELARTIGAALRLIIEESQDAARLTRLEPAAAARQLGALTARSRTALADARHVLTGYRSVSPEAELRAVTTLLAAAGIQATIELPDEQLPGELPGSVRTGLRAAVARALSGGVAGDCVLIIGRDEGGELGVRLAGERSFASGGAA
jgi:two-component system sensor histidine kinase DesK